MQASGSVASMRVLTATELAGSVDGKADRDHDRGRRLRRDSSVGQTIRHAGPRRPRDVPLDAGTSDEVHELAALHAKLFAAPDDERDAAAGIAIKLLKHPRFEAARAAEAAGRRVWREAPVSLRIDRRGRERTPRIVDGQVDLAYETDAGWVIVDFKTDIEIASAQDAYKQQVALYVEAVQTRDRPSRQAACCLRV